MNKLTLAIVLSAIAPSKEQSEEAARHAETIISMGLTQAETETCKKEHWEESKAVRILLLV